MPTLTIDATPVLFDPSTLGRDAAMVKYGPLVKFVVGRLSLRLPAVIDYEDLVSFGTMGLMEALERFDASKGVKFETYAILRVRGSIMDALRKLDRLPRSVRQRSRQLDSASADLASELGRAPTAQEVATHVGMSLGAYHRAVVDGSWVTVSLDGLVDNEDGEGNFSMPADPGQANFTARLEKKELLQSLSGAVKSLPRRESLVVSLYYGDEVSMKEIATILEVSESRVSQLHSRALRILRSLLFQELAA